MSWVSAGRFVRATDIPASLCCPLVDATGLFVCLFFFLFVVAWFSFALQSNIEHKARTFPTSTHSGEAKYICPPNPPTPNEFSTPT